MEAALRTLHDTPCVRLGGSEPAPAGGEGGGAGAEGGEWPLRLVDDGDGWKELGLPEHRLTLGFEVVFELPSARLEPMERTFERELAIGEGGSGWQ
jgi:hypothetical protein